MKILNTMHRLEIIRKSIFLGTFLIQLSLLQATVQSNGKEIRTSSHSQSDDIPHVVPIDIKLQLSKTGKRCLSVCEARGKSYSWCYLSLDSQTRTWPKWSWDECSPRDGQTLILKSLAVDGVLSSNGIPCKSKCSRAGSTSYDWCKTILEWKIFKISRVTNWDYCSPPHPLI